MSGELQFQGNLKGRLLREEEKAVLGVMLGPNIELNLDNIRVTDADDGDMGEVRFNFPNKTQRCFGEQISRAEFFDADGVLVSVTLNLDSDGELFELDFWKTDFKPLLKYPRADQIKISSGP
jgi:hypothetical protein